MNSIDLLHNLQPYKILLEQLKEKELQLSKQVDASKQISMRLTSAYSFISLKLFKQEDLYLVITFEIKNTNIVLNELYCEDKTRIEEFNTYILQSGIMQTLWNETLKAPLYINTSISEYLTIADSIAEKALNCCHGDNYSPGYYSSIVLTEKNIILSQVNHMNSRSSNHKENYSLRLLEMHISIQDESDSIRCDYQIGKLNIFFQDNSSKNNKHCGDAIIAQIQQEKKSFETTHS